MLNLSARDYICFMLNKSIKYSFPRGNGDQILKRGYMMLKFQSLLFEIRNIHGNEFELLQI